MNKRKIVIALVVVIFIASLGGNAYWFGRQWFNKQITNIFNAGANALRNTIIEVIKRDGFVILTSDSGEQIRLMSVGQVPTQ